MITLGGIDISDDMYLDGLESALLVSVEQLRTIDGVSIIKTKPTPGGRNFTLGSQNKSGATQGIWCSETIDLIKALELASQVVSLDYRGTVYSVIITGAKFAAFHQFEIEGPYKKFTGNISLTEV